MTGGQAIVRSLKQYGIDTIFGLPGVQLDNTFDALYEERDSIRVLQTRHEQATAYMAMGYSQSTGKIGVCLVVPGPGVLNAGAALSTAYATNTPVLCLTGQIESGSIDRGIGLLHEIPDQIGAVRSFTKWAARADHPSEAPGLIREAFQQMRTGRPRPVEFEMAPDIMGMTADIELLDPVLEYDQPEPDPDLIDQAAQRLGQARNPVILVGGGIFGAEEELRQLAEMLQAPVIMSSSGRGAISDRHYLAHTIVGGRMLAPDADAILAIGTRISRGPVNPSDPEVAAKLIRIDVDPEEMTRSGTPAIGILSNARSALAELVTSTDRYNTTRASREEELKAVKEKVADIFFELQPQASFAEVIREELPDDGKFVSEVTQVGFFAQFGGFPFYEPRTFVNAGYQGTLGFGFATALGTQVANPDKKVISVNGDGGFMYTMPELSTAVLHKVPLVAIVFNDNAFGNVKRIQRENYGGRMIAADLHNPDFVKLAESFGAAGLRAEGPEDLRRAIREGFDNRHPTLIEVPVGEMASIWPLAFGS